MPSCELCGRNMKGAVPPNLEDTQQIPLQGESNQLQEIRHGWAAQLSLQGPLLLQHPLELASNEDQHPGVLCSKI
jgi:hypothetical protein